MDLRLKPNDISKIINIIVNGNSEGSFWVLNKDNMSILENILGIRYYNYMLFDIVNNYSEIFELFNITHDESLSKGIFYKGKRVMFDD